MRGQYARGLQCFPVRQAGQMRDERFCLLIDVRVLLVGATSPATAETTAGPSRLQPTQRYAGANQTGRGEFGVFFSRSGSGART